MTLQSLFDFVEHPAPASADAAWLRATSLAEVDQYQQQQDEPVGWEYWIGLRSKAERTMRVRLRQAGLADSAGWFGEAEPYSMAYARTRSVPSWWVDNITTDFAIIGSVHRCRDAQVAVPDDVAAFADAMLAAYRADLIPVGWMGCWPAGNLIVAEPRVLTRPEY
jgi:hypothetical protein